MIDLSPMKRVKVDPSARQASVEPGCTLADFDAAAQAHGLATPLGINSTTGVAGLTLGGGFGWLEPKVRHDRRQPACRGGRHRRWPSSACQHQRERRPVLGSAWWRRQLRHRHQLRVPASCGRAECTVRADRLPVQRGEIRAYAVRPLYRDDAGRTQCVDGHAQGAAAAFPVPRRSTARRSSRWRCAMRAILPRGKR